MTRLLTTRFVISIVAAALNVATIPSARAGSPDAAGLAGPAGAVALQAVRGEPLNQG